jgi:hypothetical protein
LLICGAALDLHFCPAGFDGVRHAAHAVNFLDDLPGLVSEILGQPLHHVGTGPGVDDVGDMRLFLDHQLGVAGDARRELGRQGDGFVKRVGVQRLRATKNRGHCFDGRAHDVVVGILLGQRPARSLAVRAQHARLRILRPELLHRLPPQQAGGAQLGHFQVEVHADGEEERQPAGEGVDVQAGSNAVRT